MSIATIPANVTTGTNNVSKRGISDGILGIIEMGSPPAATATLSYLDEKFYNALSWAQGCLKEEVEVMGSTNTVLSTSEPSLLDLYERSIN